VKGRILFVFFIAHFAAADALDDAVGQWSKKISSHLAADEIAHITWKDAGAVDAGSAAYIARAKTSLARALQRRLKDPKPVEITAAFSQNLKDYLFIAEMHRENESIVEIASMPRTMAAPAPSAGFRLERKLLWEQEAPILDVVADIGTAGDQMLVLDTTGVTLYEHHESKWQKTDGAALDFPPVRDPRGRLTMMEHGVVADVAGLTCKGTWSPSVTVECQSGGRFTGGRNTMEEAGWPPYFAHAELGSEHIIAAVDGRTFIYDASRKQLNAADLGDDFAVISSACTSPKILAADSTANSLAIFELVNHNPVRVSDAMELPGAVTALWSGGTSGLVVVRNKSTNRYEAYSVGLDCGR
jgi:hypothetical protein